MYNTEIDSFDKRMNDVREEIGEALLRLGECLGVDIHSEDIKELALRNHFQGKKVFEQ